MKRYKLSSPNDWMLPLLLFGFIGLTVTFLTPIFNTSTRWLILFFIACYLAYRREIFKPFKSNFGIACLTLILWCILTTAWSEIPELSGFKSIAFFIIVTTSMACGMLWVEKNHHLEALNYLVPLTYITILAGLLGKITSNSTTQLSETVQLYQGAVGGSNMFGSMLSMCAPLLVWKVYICTGRIRKYWLTLLGIALFYLLASKARSSFLSVTCTLIFFYMGYRNRHKIPIFLGIALSSLAMYFFLPDLVTEIEKDYIYKHDTEEGVLYSRTSTWEESYEQAIKGGVFGGGYGVTIGDNNFELGATAATYGREKANSQLGILEETGFVGLALYAFVIISLLFTLRRGILIRQAGPASLQLLLVIGTLVGMLVKSLLEAWWSAPSSPESVYFWSLVGVALGLCHDRRTRRQA